MPNVWGSTLVPIYKNKGDIQSCTKYYRIKAMRHVKLLMTVNE